MMHWVWWHLSVLQWLGLFSLILAANVGALVLVHVLEWILGRWRKRRL